jgi:two-component system response regulator HydG
MPVEEIASLVEKETEVSVRPKILKSGGGLHSNDSQCFFLILDERDLIKIGEVTSRVRGTLTQEQPLILCIPVPIEPAALLDLGATAIITPASKAQHSIAERIAAQIIMTKAVLPNRCGSLYGATKPMRELYVHIATLAPLDEPLLVLGETGTGKELIAREVHGQSGRSNNYIAVNCAELSSELLGSELFGHEKGAFTNAIQTRKGLIAEAGKGTVFLDEIGELDPLAQAKLLRVLEDRKVRRVGANQWEEVGARIILATNRNLEEDCETGRFRRDLFERIRGFTLYIAPLRERKADIPLLVQHFVESYNEEYCRNLKIPPGSVDSLFRYHWPGNVRELRANVRKAAAYADKRGNISALILQETTRVRPSSQNKNTIQFDPAADTWRDVQRIAQSAYLRAVLLEARGNKDVAIKLSGLSKSQFYEKLKDIE